MHAAFASPRPGLIVTLIDISLDAPILWQEGLEPSTKGRSGTILHSLHSAFGERLEGVQITVFRPGTKLSGCSRLDISVSDISDEVVRKVIEETVCAVLNTTLQSVLVITSNNQGEQARMLAWLAAPSPG